MHTDHSSDCATPVETLLATARDAGLGAIAITDHNEISGAFAAAEIADEFGVKVILAEEVKTAEQGEVIGLFLNEKIERGMTMAETIAEIRRQGGLVYVPHPFDRLHSVPDYEHLLDIVEEIDILEVFNPRVALTAFNEEAERFAAKYRIVPGAGSDSHVAQGLGSVMIRVHDFDGPEEFLESMRDADIVRKKRNLIYVQTLKWLQTGGGRGRASAPASPGGQGADAGRRGRQEGGRCRQRRPAARKAGREDRLPTTDDEIQEKYLERAIRELNQLTHRLQECSHCPRGNLMPVLGSGHPQADIMLLKFAPTAAEIEEGVAFYGRSGNALMKSFKRLGIDPLAVYGTLCVEVPGLRPGAGGGRVHRADRRGDRDRPAALHRRHGRAGARDPERGRACRSRASSSRRSGEIQKLTPTIEASTCPTSTTRSTPRSRSASSGARSARSATGTPTCRRTESRRHARR